jgi:hypothetical protein
MNIIQSLTLSLQSLQSGEITFEEYLDNHPDAQEAHHYRAATAARRAHNWSDDEFQLVKLELDSEYRGGVTMARKPAKPVFNPFETKTNVTLAATEEELAKVPTGRVKTRVEEKTENGVTTTKKIVQTNSKTEVEEKRKRADGKRGRLPKAPNLARDAKSNRFLPGVGELWFIDEDGILQKEAYVSSYRDDGSREVCGIARAFDAARRIQAYWSPEEIWGQENEVAVVKFRKGDYYPSDEASGTPGEYKGMAGGKAIVYANSNGKVLSHEQVTKWHAEAKARKLGHLVERANKMSNKTIKGLLGNTPFASGRGWSDAEGAADISRDVKPFEEPEDAGAITYSVRYLSGAIVPMTLVPLADSETTDGHRIRAIRLLLEDAPCTGADVPSTVKYKHDDTWFVVSRIEALQWANPVDDVLNALEDAYRPEKGEPTMGQDEYIRKRTARMNVLDPAPKPKRSPVTNSPRTRIDHNADGTINWQKASQGHGIGAKWSSSNHGSQWGASIYNY